MDDGLKTRVKNLNTRIQKALDGAEAVGGFVGALLHASMIAHVMHLKTRSYAAHMALGEFYAGLPGLVDSFAETYQGRYGLIEGYPTTLSMPVMEPAEFMRVLKGMVEGERGKLPQDTQLQNIVDEIAALIDGTAYKLTFLS